MFADLVLRQFIFPIAVLSMAITSVLAAPPNRLDAVTEQYADTNQYTETDPYSETKLSGEQRSVWLLDVKGVIGPAVADYVIRGLEDAHSDNAQAVVLQIDTPGGLDKSMRQIIRAILAAPIPIIGFVSPGGARAASAGTYILYACHVAAMAKATNLGAATPVQIGVPGLPGLPEEKDPLSPAKDKDTKPQTKPRTPVPSTAMQRKIINDAAAYIEGLAQLRQRNVEWAVKAVREGVSLSAVEAKSLHVIDLLAQSVDDLLQQVDGREIVIDNRTVVLKTGNAAIERHRPDWRSEFLAIITDPNVAYLLMLVGIYGLIFEFSNPGMGVPGVLGAICLLLALYAFQVLPISYAGLGLIILGVGLMVAEAFAPSFGVLGLGGIVAFIVGSIILMDTNLPGYKIALPVILGITTASAAVLVFLLGMVLRARRQAVTTGLASLVGQTAEVENSYASGAVVRLQGELWQVNCDQPLQEGDSVRVRTADSVVLDVDRYTDTDRKQE